MLRSTQTQCVMIGLASILCGSTALFAEASWKLYDLRDLVSALPPAYQEDDSATEPGTNIQSMFNTRPNRRPLVHSTVEPGRNIDELLRQACGAMNAVCTRLVTGVYGVEAEDADHARMHGLLEGLRNLYRERYAIDLVLYRTPADQAPPIGAEAQTITPTTSQRFVVSRRTPTPVEINSQISFLSGLSPVVATSALGYAPENDSVNDGLEVSFLVGTEGDDQDGTTSVNLVGELRKVAWPDDENEFKTPFDGRFILRFPIVHVRSIQSHLRIKHGKLIVLSVLVGFEENTSIVLAASVRKL